MRATVRSSLPAVRVRSMLIRSPGMKRSSVDARAPRHGRLQPARAARVHRLRRGAPGRPGLGGLPELRRACPARRDVRRRSRAARPGGGAGRARARPSRARARPRTGRNAARWRASTLAEGLHLKLEGQNPTGSHKDRFQAIAVGAARALGFRGVVASSTGNHGAAAAAFAAHAGMPSLVCLNPDAPAALASQITGYGGTIAVLPGDVAELIGHARRPGLVPVHERRPRARRPQQSLWRRGVQGDRLRDRRGARRASVGRRRSRRRAATRCSASGAGSRISTTGSASTLPTLLACQPAGSAPLTRSHEAHPRRIEHPVSLALSARDDLSGRHAAALVRRGAAIVVTVEEDELADAVRRLGHAGFYVEPASGLALAGPRERAAGRARCRPRRRPSRSSRPPGLNWTRDLDVVFGEAVIHRSVDAVLGALDAA